VVSGFNPPAGTPFQVISGGLEATPLYIDRDAGNGYVFDFSGASGTLTLVARPANLTLPPHISLLRGYPGTLSFLMDGEPGLTYCIQTTHDVGASTADWPAIHTTNTPSGLIQLLLTNSVRPERFFQAVTP
jgi:hypothetical protein